MTENNNKNSQSVTVAALVLIGAAILIQSGYLAWRQYEQYQTLTSQIEAQDSKIQKAAQVREQLESLASQTAKLAEQGNKNAAQLVEALREQGITIKNKQ